MSTTAIGHDTFNQIVDKEGIVFIDWWAAWCGPCKMFAPIYEAAAERHPDVTWGKVDVDAEQQLAGAFTVRSIPTLMVFRDGVLLFEQPGVLPAKALDELVKQVSAIDMEEIRERLAAEEASGGAEPSAPG